MYESPFAKNASGVLPSGFHSLADAITALAKIEPSRHAAARKARELYPELIGDGRVTKTPDYTQQFERAVTALRMAHPEMSRVEAMQTVRRKSPLLYDLMQGE